MELQKLKETNDIMVKELTDVKNKCATTDLEFRQTQEQLLDAIAEMNVSNSISPQNLFPLAISSYLQPWK